MSSPLRIVLAGCGGISAAWLNAIKTQPDVEMVGFVDINPAAAHKRAAEYGWTGALVSDDLCAVLDQARPDILFLGRTALTALLILVLGYWFFHRHSGQFSEEV